MSMPEIRLAVHVALRALALAVIVLLLLRLAFRPRAARFGTQSTRYRIGRASDFLVAPIHAMLPPGTSGAVATVLAIVTVLLATYFAMSVANDLLGAAAGVIASLSSGAPEAALGFLLYGAVSIYTTLLILRIFLSWVRVGPWGGGWFTRFLYDVTEPVLAIFRGLIPPLGMIDLSPLVVFFLLQLLKGAIRAFFFAA